jgi:hypothetical protein
VSTIDPATSDQIEQALKDALARLAHRDPAEQLINALSLEQAGESGAWDISFVVVPDQLEHDFELATAEVHLLYPKMKLAA